MTTLAPVRSHWIRWMTIISVSVLFIPGSRLAASSQGRKTSHAHKPAKHSRVRHYRRHHRYRHDYTRIHLSPERIRQIQEALIKAGFFHEQPDGIWGTTTRDAMRQFQEANGFSPTGLPEAKPLMKLGLGPHPLPPGLEPALSKEADAHGGAQPSTTETSSAATQSSASNP